MHYTGLDISKKTIEMVQLDPHGKEVNAATIPNTKQGLQQLINTLSPDDQVGMEAGTYANPIVETLSRAHVHVHVGDPGRLKPLMDPDVKTDPRDAWHLADLLRVGRFHSIWIPEPGLFRARDLTRRRQEHGEEVTRLKNRIRALLARYGIEPPMAKLWGREGFNWLKKPHFRDDRDLLLGAYIAELELLLHHEREFEAQLALIALETPPVRVLMSLEGANLVNAFTILHESGPTSRYKSEAHYRAYAGAAPKMSDSGQVIQRGKRRRVNRRLKKAYSSVTETLLRSPRTNPVKTYYQQQLAKVSSKKKAKARARRKTVNIVRGMLRTMDPCRWGDAGLTQRKWAHVERLARAAKAVSQRSAPGA